MQKGNRATIVIGIITLIVLGFIISSTIFNQIIDQNEGFFYILIFGGILVLVFVLMSLITKLLAISSTGTYSVLYSFLEAVLMLVTGGFFLYHRLSFTSSLRVEDTLFYRTAVFMTDDSLSGSLDVVTKILNNPVDYSYALLLSKVFSVTGAESGVVVYVNAVLLLLTALFAAHIVHTIGGRICGFIAFVSTLFIPALSYSVYTFNSTLFFTLLILCILDFYLQIYLRDNIHIVIRILIYIFLAVSTALMLITDFVTVILYILILIHYFIYSGRSGKSFLATSLGIILIFVVLVFMKASLLGVPSSDVFSASFSRFNPVKEGDSGETNTFSDVIDLFNESLSDQNKNINDNYSFLTKDDGTTISAVEASWLQLATSIIYMFSIILGIGCVIFMFRTKNSKAVPCMLITCGLVLCAFFKAAKDANGFYIFEMMVILGAIGLAYMYENHHPELFVVEDIWSEQKEEEEEEKPVLSLEEQEELLRRARAIIFIGEDEELYEQIKKEEELERKDPSLKKEAKKQKEQPKMDPGDEHKKDDPDDEYGSFDDISYGYGDYTEDHDDYSDDDFSDYHDDHLDDQDEFMDDHDDLGEYDDDFGDDHNEFGDDSDDFGDEFKEDLNDDKHGGSKGDFYDDHYDDTETGKYDSSDELSDEEDETEGGRYLKNPLPLPKKHVEKKLDFDDDDFEEDGFDDDDLSDDGFDDDLYDDE